MDIQQEVHVCVVMLSLYHYSLAYTILWALLYMS
jgi:hypothetical protein